MNSWTLIRRGLSHYWRTHLGVLAGSAVATAVLVGAMVAGDSVRASLRAMALARLGSVELALDGGDRFFRDALANDLAEGLDAEVAPVLALRGSAKLEAGAARVNNVQVLGVTDRFWTLGGSSLSFGKGAGEVIVNERLAGLLGVKAGESIQLRFERPSLLPRDAPLSVAKDASTALTLRIRAVAADGDFGRFSLRADQIPPASAFVPLSLLQRQAQLEGKANLLLAGGRAELTPQAADEALRRVWKLADAELEVRALSDGGPLELRSGRIFLDRPAVEAAERCGHPPFGVLTYFVNAIRLGRRATPYSFVAATGAIGADKPSTPPPERLNDGGIIINDWLAEDLQAKAGDELTLSYYVLGPMRTLAERSDRFRVRKVVKIKESTEERELMPAFPGLAEAERTSCRNWEPGIPIDLERIRPKDEAYWERYRGTPKAFVTLAAGRRMWANRFGELTAVRFPLPRRRLAELEEAIRLRLDPAAVGLYFQPVRKLALEAGSQGQNFGHLFLALSMFLIAAAGVLTWLLFVFGAEQRSEEIGTLLALGFLPRRVGRLLLAEGAVLAVVGAALGSVGGMGYTLALLGGLRTVWSGAAAETAALHFHARASSVALGFAVGILIALAAMWVTLRRYLARPARELLASGGAVGAPGPLPRRRKAPLIVALVAAAGAAGALIAGLAAGTDTPPTWSFFASGALLLTGGIAACRALLGRLARGRAGRMSLAAVGFRAGGRRPGRSLATIALLACGSFLVVAVGANRRDPQRHAERRDSGTGGFALLGESAVAVYHDMNSPAGREALGLDRPALSGVEFVQLRLRGGDDASCLNMNRPQRPRLLGVAPEELARRGAFRFVKTLHPPPAGGPWRLLETSFPDGAVPAIGDVPTIRWALGTKLGRTLSYTDEQGREFKVRLVGMIADSILQGGLVISEEQFVRRFPSASGYRSFLIDVPAGGSAAVVEAMSAAMGDHGLELTAAAQRLAELSTVQNTYLSIFQILGALGMLLGSAALAVVVGRNVMERRGELALLRAVGFSRRAVRRIVLAEHLMLVVLGLACGVVAAAVAVAPALASPGAKVPYASLAATLAAVGIGGVVWTFLATIWATRGPLLAALRNE